MDNVLLIIVFVLLLLSILDLVVGVSNDAVNFLNSAIGAKAAPRYVIMTVASIGILLGSLFSGGMMEVARKGVFYPQQFYLMEIMVIFLAVMLTDVLLLDFFNTFGLPTSTTVSLVFELLGAAVAVSLMKIASSADGTLADLTQYINAGKALAIISGIFISIAVAFIVGGAAMYITRFIFTFNYKKTFKYVGSAWGGIALTAILYFIVMKGIIDSAVFTPELISYIQSNTWPILLISFATLTLLFQLFISLFNFNLLKYIVLAGTFALALSFAGNDLVNFIGVFMAALKSYQIFLTSGIPANQLMMGELAQPVSTNALYLLIAGAIMTITLWLSKKARTVTETEVSLARQEAGVEKFGSTSISRGIVRGVINANNSVERILPNRVRTLISSRFNTEEHHHTKKTDASFDMLRASVNLTISSILIASATSLKLPLSTTYVTFMVAMATSLSDRAWGRESAVYRVTGVLTVISGWFFTALIAFTASMLVAFFLHATGVVGILIMVVVAFFAILKSNKIHNRKSKDDEANSIALDMKEEAVIQRCVNEVNKALRNIVVVYNETIHGLSNEDRKLLKKVNSDVEEINRDTKKYKDNLYHTLTQLQSDSVETGHYYVQVIDYLREIAHSLSFITKPSFDHIDNNHKGLIKEQVVELKSINYEVSALFSEITRIVNEQSYADVPEVIKRQQQVLELLNSVRKKQIKRIKNGETSTRNSNLYLGLLNETKNLLLQTINLLKAERDFIEKHKEIVEEI
jgi:phosphate/sulfate permease